MSSVIKKISLIGIVVLFIYSLLGFFLVPYITKQQLQKILNAKFAVTPEIQKISFNPFTFEMTVEGFDLPSSDKSVDAKSRLKFAHFSVNLSIFPLLKKELRISSIVLKEAQAQFVIFKNGATNWAMKKDPEEKESSSKEKSTWVLTLEHIQMDRSSLDFLDKTHVRPLDLPLGPLSLTASNISTSLGSETSLNSLAISVGEKGHLKINGVLSPDPFTANLNLDILGLPLDFLTAYLSDKTYLTLKEGQLDLLGTLKYDKGNILFNGNSLIRQFKLEQEESKESVLSWEKMDLQGIKLQTVPLSLRVDTLALTKPKTEVIIRKDGTLNFKSFLRSEKPSQANTTAETSSEEQTSKTPVAKAEDFSSEKPFQFSIAKISLTDGELDFTDQTIRPNFSAHVHGLGGTVDPISSSTSEKILTDLNGLVEDYGKFKAKGYVIPSNPKLALNLDVNFHNIEMTTFTPYSGHFAGYEIKKGKLFLDLNYTLLNNRIKGKNDVLLDQFTLGNKVESEKATNLPLKLALALMKDRKGQIKFKLPVEGDVNSPSFSLGNLIFTALKNMLINIIAAPFDFISSLIGGGKDLQLVYFEPGTNTLQKDQEEKFAKIAQALEERPNLAVEIKGQYQTQDIEALQKKNIETQLEPYLKRNSGNRLKSVRSLAQSSLKRDVYNRFMDEYESRSDKSDDLLIAELEKKLSSTVVVSEEELKALGLSRGRIVMDGIIHQKVSAEKLYLLAGTKSENDDKPTHTLLSLKDK